ncbi:DEAD/DEAH box helicase [Dermabacter sp. p3-SID358]|uniref:DEAD/DEAH box helicase n=1 Tax=Dermabacter sp. p3-SID358 TaxID=2916114 RepID=UPI0021A45DB4|nr:DEAD/DEAH box helicase [Dermabacter sp. p3-SID358]MCT1867575.1 DEAD/DEAH box helicase [Dermabacter sp. p3-SID358]
MDERNRDGGRRPLSTTGTHEAGRSPAYRSCTLHLHADTALGVSLWAHATDTARHAHILDSLDSALSALSPDGRHPAPLAALGPWLARPMRHVIEVEFFGRRTRVRTLALESAHLAEFMTALRARIAHLARASATPRDTSDDGIARLISELAEAGRPLDLGEGILLAPETLALLNLDSHARRIVKRRDVVPGPESAHDTSRVRWRLAPGLAVGTSPTNPALEHLVDAHARATFTRLRKERERAGELPGADELAGLDPVGAALLDALDNSDALLTLDTVNDRRVRKALDSFVDSALAGVLLSERQPRLTVRVREAEKKGYDAGSATVGLRVYSTAARWQVEVCLAETSGRVHLLGDLVNAGDLTSVGALEHASHVRRLSPTLAGTHAEPGGLTWNLSTKELSRFLTEEANVLEAEGITVMLPREWTKQRVSVVAKVATPEEDDRENRPAKSTGFSGAMASFEFGVAVGESMLSPDELEELLEEQRELVNIRGKWVRLDSSTLRAATAFLQGARRVAAENSREGERDALTDVQFRGLLTEGGLEDLDLSVEAETSNGDELLFGTDKVAVPALPAPRTLKATLRPYQKRGLDWLSFLDARGVGGILADDMGLGKTMQVLAFLAREREKLPRIGPTLLVCPMSVLGSWQREAERWLPSLKVHIHHGPDRLHGEAFRERARASHLTLTTYALVSRDFDDLAAAKFHRVVLDEAQHVKNHDTGVTQAVKALPEGRRLALTGTPVENDLTDLHSILSITTPGLLPSEAAFKERFVNPINEGNRAVQERLSLLTRPFILRRVKTDRSIISDLPEKREERELVNITEEQAGLYKALVEDMTKQLEELSKISDPITRNRRRRTIVSTTIMKMKQVLGHPAHFLGDGSPVLDASGEHRSGKLERLDTILESVVANNEKALIFTQFTAFAPTMLEHWETTFGLRVPFLHGGISKAERDEMVREFQNSPGTPGAMLLSLRAGGTGITLTAANHVIHLDRWWNPAVENQATDRAFRIGQTRDVSVHKLISIGTIEEKIDDVLRSKLELAEHTVRSGEGWLTELSNDKLAEIVSLDDARKERRS